MLKHAFVSTALLLALCLLSANAVVAETRIALLIGNKAYTQAVGPLSNPLNDVALIGKALRSIGFDLITVKDGSRKQIRRASHPSTVQQTIPVGLSAHVW